MLLRLFMNSFKFSHPFLIFFSGRFQILVNFLLAARDVPPRLLLRPHPLEVLVVARSPDHCQSAQERNPRPQLLVE
jgi:hypothetical protein